MLVNTATQAQKCHYDFSSPKAADEGSNGRVIIAHEYQEKF